jgi:hypothetical protein
MQISSNPLQKIQLIFLQPSLQSKGPKDHNLVYTHLELQTVIPTTQKRTVEITDSLKRTQRKK